MMVEGMQRDAFRGWRRNLTTIWIAQLLAIVGFSFTTPFLPLFIRELGITRHEEIIWWAGLMNAGSALVMAVTAPLWGALADRHGRKPMVLRAMFGGALIIGLMTFAPNVQTLFLLRIIQGTLTGTVTASITLVASITPRERLGVSLGLMQTAVFSGNSFGPLLGGITADAIGFRGSFVVTGGLLALAGVLVLCFVREQFERPAAASSGRSAIGGIFSPLSNRLIMVMVVTLCLLSLATMAVSPLIPIYVELLGNSARNTASLSGAAIGIVGVTSAVAAILFGRLADRLGRRRILIGCSCAAGVLALVPAFVRTPGELIIARGLYGLAAGGMVPTANALVADVTPVESRGAVYGLISAAASLGSALGPLGGSALAALVSIRAVFIATAGLLICMGGWIQRMITPAVVSATRPTLPRVEHRLSR